MIQVNKGSPANSQTRTYTTGASPADIVLGDFNGDWEVRGRAYLGVGRAGRAAVRASGRRGGGHNRTCGAAVRRHAHAQPLVRAQDDLAVVESGEDGSANVRIFIGDGDGWYYQG